MLSAWLSTSGPGPFATAVWKRSLLAFTATFVVLILVPTALQGLVLVIGLPLSLVGGWRALRLSIELDGTQVVVKNYWRTHRFSWSEVEEIRPAAVTFGFALAETLGFQLRSGRLVSAQAVSGKLRVRAAALAVLLPFARREGVRISAALSREMEGPEHARGGIHSALETRRSCGRECSRQSSGQ